MDTNPRGVMFQYFEWNLKNDCNLWVELAGRAREIKNLGTTAVWLPPAYKAMNGINDTGYAPYDLFDLGEFDQKGTTRTKYGTKDEFLAAVKAVQAAGMDAYCDVVLDHRMGGDETEEVEVVQVDPNDRTHETTGRYKIKAYSKYNFPGRGDKYSAFKWNQEPLRRLRVRRQPPGRDGPDLQEGRRAVQRRGGPRARQLRLPDGGRRQPLPPGRDGRGDRLGQVVHADDRAERVPAGRGQAHAGQLLPGLAGGHAGPLHGPRAVRRGRVLDGRQGGDRSLRRQGGREPCGCSTCRCTSTCTRRRCGARTTTCGSCSTGRWSRRTR